MAKIVDSKGRSDAKSGYSRLFGNQQLGQLISRVQAAVIRTGNELERIIENETPVNQKTSLDAILSYYGDIFPSDVQVVFQPRMPRELGKPGITVDIAVFDHSKRQVSIIELKDGDTFDTKKASGELESMSNFAGWISRKIGYDASFFFCSFNQDDKEAIVRGAKGRFGIERAMTGRELCDILTIDYDVLRERRQSEQSENLRFFVEELLKISEIRQMIVALLRGEKTAGD